jgi:selenocysteine lyase/cysteine desulfurase
MERPDRPFGRPRQVLAPLPRPSAPGPRSKGRRTFLSAAAGWCGVLAPGLTRERLEAAAQAVSGRSPEDVARDEDFWLQVRHAFSIDRNHINLNSGSVSPAPLSVQRTMQDYWHVTNMSPSLYVDEMLGPRLEVPRRRLAAMFGCDPEEMAITRNTSEGMEIVQLGLNLKAGDEVLTTTQDYPRMLTTWRQREKRDGIVLKTVPYSVPVANLDDLVRAIERAITPKTKVITICHVTYTTGQIFPVRKICQMARARGIETVIDGAHGFAQFPFTRDELDCDYYATSLHKWLLAPVGTGFLYVRKAKIPNVWPLMTAPEEMADNIRKFEEVGTFPVAIPGSITEAITFHESIGAERKAARLRYLRRRWADKVKNVPKVRVLNADDPAQTGGLGAMLIEGVGANALTAFLEKHYFIHVRPRFVTKEFECIRVAPNVFTTLEEVDLFARAIEHAATRGIS